MPALGLAACLLALEPILSGGVTSELRGGEAPLNAGESPRATIAWTTTPVLELRALAPDLILRIDYTPRILFRTPNLSGDLRPLVLHQASVSLEKHLGPTTVASLEAQGAIGELDYSALQLALGGTQGAVPNANEIAQVGARARLRFSPSRLWDATIDARALYREPLGTPPTTAMPTPTATGTVPIYFLPKQTVVGAAPGVLGRLDARDQLGVAIDGTYYSHDTGLRILALTPTLGWTRRLGHEDRLVVRVGATFADELHAALATSTIGWTVNPVGDANLLIVLGSTRDVLLTADFAGAATYYVDPVLDRGTPRATVGTGINAAFGPLWSAGLNASFATNTTAHPQPLYPDETVVYVTTPVRRKISSVLAIEGGGRWIERAPHLRAPMFGFRERELWAYVAVAALFDVAGGKNPNGATGNAQ